MVQNALVALKVLLLPPMLQVRDPEMAQTVTLLELLVVPR